MNNKNVTNRRSYIELSSAHRDRNRFPNPSQFEVSLGLVGNQNTTFTSTDAVFQSTMTFPHIMKSESPNVYNNYSYMAGTLLNGSMVPNDNFISVLPYYEHSNERVVPIYPSELQNAYNGDVLELITNTASSSITLTNEFRKIKDYKILDEPQVVTAEVDSTTYPITTRSVPLDVTSDIDHFYDGWTITFTNTTNAALLNVQRKVTYYRAFDKRVFFDEPITVATISDNDDVELSIDSYTVELETPFSIGALPSIADNSVQSDNTTFRIRREQPILQGTLAAGTSRTFTLPASAGTRDFTGDMIWITTDPVAFSGTLDSTSFVSDGTTQIQGTFTLTGAGGFEDNFFNGMQIEITSGTFSGYVYTITDWDQGTQVGTVTPGWTSLVAGTTSPGAATFRIVQQNPSQYRLITSYDTATRIGTVSKPFSYTNESGTTTTYAVGSSDTFDIIRFEKDSYQALNYTNSTVVQQQAVCHEIELNSLIIPNVPITSGYGGTIIDYPFVYVEFKSIMQGTSYNDFYSNNPAASKAMFKAIPFHNNYPTMRFLPMDGHGIIQTLKFKPNDAFLFSVYLPDGELMTFDADYVSPSDPNPLLQISAVFAVMRAD